jgi:hypothetical protein
VMRVDNATVHCYEVLIAMWVIHKVTIHCLMSVMALQCQALATHSRISVRKVT